MLGRLVRIVMLKGHNPEQDRYRYRIFTQVSSHTLQDTSTTVSTVVGSNYNNKGRSVAKCNFFAGKIVGETDGYFGKKGNLVKKFVFCTYGKSATKTRKIDISVRHKNLFLIILIFLESCLYLFVIILNNGNYPLKLTTYSCSLWTEDS